MKREDIWIGVLWIVILTTTAAAAVYAFWEAAEQTSKIVVGIMGATGVLLGGILTHALTALREQRMELQRQRQLNYASLIEKLAPFVRSPKTQADEFTKAHLYSWVVGSPDVVRFTADFMQSRSEGNLKQLLLAMRSDVGLAYTDAPLQEVFRPVEPTPPPEALSRG